ncbi:LacI family DNA-binding transcriptional regulator [Cryobacterium sp. Hh7]|uniref:LacI family DNA-binding transcriptional regulator n=1 Tax=Cryobacterium sp. Hh7 TaxID=1259159 RepID=UPI00141BABB3|nr:LacI family DNA-binding transcriptional regulator [Cryobacterium sp. Hh7]
MTDVAREAGVSLKTVSRVVNNVATVESGMAERVRAAVITLGFRPNQLAATLKSGASTATVGLVVRDLSNSFYSALATGAAGVARRHGTQVITATIGESASPEEEIELIFELCRRRVDGLIIVAGPGDHSVLAGEIGMGTPMVFVDRVPRGLVTDSVVLDNAGGAHAAIERLIADGHRQIGLVMDHLDIEPIRARFEGAKAAMREAGLLVSQAPTATGVRTPGGAAEAVSRMLDSNAAPSAIFCGNNRATLGAIEEIWRRRSRVAVAGFDNFPLAHLMPIPLTLVEYDASDMGRRAAEMLFRRFERHTELPEQVILPTTLIQSGIGWGS